jgi:hypothetical protein
MDGKDVVFVVVLVEAQVSCCCRLASGTEDSPVEQFVGAARVEQVQKEQEDGRPGRSDKIVEDHEGFEREGDTWGRQGRRHGRRRRQPSSEPPPTIRQNQKSWKGLLLKGKKDQLRERSFE